MPKIDLFPDESTIIDSYDLGAIADIDGRSFRVSSSDPNPINIRHKLERLPLAFLLAGADRDVRLWQANVTRESFDLFRSDPSANIQVLVI